MRISDWSSDVCSSDLYHAVRDGSLGRRCGRHRLAEGPDDAARPRPGGGGPAGHPGAPVGRPAHRLLGLDQARWGAALSEVLRRSEEHTSELQSHMRISYAVICLTKKQKKQ